MFNRLSRRNFLWAASVPFARGLSGLPSERPLLSQDNTGNQKAGNAFPGIEVQNGLPSVQVAEAVLFPFDDNSIPFTWGLKLQLVMGKRPGRHNPIVVSRGGLGEPDSERVRYYGTVIRIGDELRMWYLGRGEKFDPKGGPLRLMYAVSKDGIKWDKPKLGFIEYNGSKQNNLVDLMGGQYGLSESVVIYDPEDTDPSRRFKMAFEAGKYGNRLAVAFSSDGLHWTESPKNPVGSFLEESGLIKFNGCYYVNGQGGGQYGSGRKMVTFASYDFERWTSASALSFRRGPMVEIGLDHWNSLEEVHLGASLMSRGNVVLGIYGMWHGVPSGDRAYVTMDLGLIVSNDAIHFREPITDFRFLPSWEELQVPLGRGPSLAQGQGMVNMTDKTLYWYEAWGTGGVRLATWDRDRLGYYCVFDKELLPHNPYDRNLPASLISCPIKLAGEGGRIFINADGLSGQTELTVELLDREFREIPGYSGADCIPMRTSSLRQGIRWRDKEKLAGIPHPIRVRVIFGGERPEDAKLYAIYVAGG